MDVDSSQPSPAEPREQSNGTTQDQVPQPTSSPLSTASPHDTSPSATTGQRQFPHVIFYFHAAPGRPGTSPSVHSDNGSDDGHPGNSTSPEHTTEPNDDELESNGEHHHPTTHSVMFIADRRELLSLLPMLFGLPPHAFFANAFGPTDPSGLQGQPPASKHAMYDLPLISRSQLQWLAQQHRLVASAEQQDEPATLTCLICQDDLLEEVTDTDRDAGEAPKSHQYHGEPQQPSNNASVSQTDPDGRANNHQGAITQPSMAFGAAASTTPLCFVRQMPCGHMFHEDCLFSWLKASNTCPTCRFEIMTDNADYNQVVERRMDERRKSQTSPLVSNPFRRGCALAPMGSCDATMALPEDSDHIWDEHYTFPQCHHDFHLPCLRTTLLTQGLEPRSFEYLAAECHHETGGASEQPGALSSVNTTTTMVRCPACSQYNSVPDKVLASVLLPLRAQAGPLNSFMTQGQVSPLALQTTESPVNGLGDDMDLD
ncbi:E3 ubiquitin-protein ligase Praja-2 [Dimargaris xerosporica]|nr:E3 ubiquitin-protein ligase Praja-2 [Dimargaris xerosporica]